MLERLADVAARESGIDPVEIRRRNLIPSDAFPYQSPNLWEYDTGDLALALDTAVGKADLDGFAQRRRESEARGLLRALGMAFYLEACGMGPSKNLGDNGCRAGQYEVANLRVHPSGGVTILTGSHSHGQGHETVFAQIVADRLGIDMDRIDIVHGDTGRIPFGLGTYGSRSLSVGGSALVLTLNKVIEKGKRIAAHLLETAESDIEFVDGTFRVAGTDRMLSFTAVAEAAYVPFNFPIDKLEPGLEETTFYDPPNFTFPYGCHIAEIEVDAETGVVVVQRYLAVDDFGRQINPLIVEGQMHGGIAQGIGQALMEGCVYDSESGQFLTGSFMDYCLPRADALPRFEIASVETTCLSNPLGAKGCGEAGTITAPAVLINAIVDALAPYGVRHVDMPATPEVVWTALAKAREAA